MLFIKCQSIQCVLRVFPISLCVFGILGVLIALFVEPADKVWHHGLEEELGEVVRLGVAGGHLQARGQEGALHSHPSHSL